MMSLSAICLFVWAPLDAGTPERDPTPLPIPFERYTVNDSLGRKITFYVSRSGNEDKTDRPIALVILGSGCQSIFQKHGDFIGGSYQHLLLQAAKGRVRVLVVEKPGVKFLDAPARPGSAEGASEEFLKEHTFERWSEANIAALRAAWTLPGVDRSRTLVVGHSEGGIIAARIAAEVREVTHVASLAGGGPSQLFDLAESRSQPAPDGKPGDANLRRQQVLDEYSAILKDPESITKFWLGHPYRRWSTFLRRSVTEELNRSKARVYLAHGTGDQSTTVKVQDVLVAELLARGRDVTVERIEGADHGFQTADMPPGPPVGMLALLERVLTWFLAPPGGKDASSGA
jgi:dienelactone hydrolase